MTIGSLGWCAIAQGTGVPLALLISAADLQQDAVRHHMGPEKPVVRHFLTIERRYHKM